MTYSQDMLNAARRGGDRLGKRTEAVRRFVESRCHPDGGFRGRGVASDLYYTVFGIDCLMALDQSPLLKHTYAYLAPFGDGAGLDFMHLVSLARCRARLDEGRELAGTGDSAHKVQLLDRLAAFACPDGGFNTVTGAPHNSVTADFLACAAYQDLGAHLPDPAGMVLSLGQLRSTDGAYANLPNLASGTTLATAGALIVRHWMGQPVDLDTAQWMLDQVQDEGGFLATPGAPVPDLLSTATAVFAMHTLGLDTTGLIPACIDFVGSLQQPNGGFSGHRFDTTADCEYTFYALMTLGCLTDEG